MGQKQKSTLEFGMSALRLDSDVRISHLMAQSSLFLRRKFPVLPLGNSTAIDWSIFSTPFFGRSGIEVSCEVDIDMPYTCSFAHTR